METKETKEIKRALIKETHKKIGCYGAFEVTVGDQRCDYVEYNGTDFACYEIKISWSDLNSKNKQTYLGKRNYLVVTDALASKIREEHYGLGGVGLIAYKNDKFKLLKKCSLHRVSFAINAALLDGFAKAASRDLMKQY